MSRFAWTRRFAAGLLVAGGVLMGSAFMVGSGAASAGTGANIDHVETSADGGTIDVVVGLPPGVSADPATVRVTVDGTPASAEAKTITTGDVLRTVVLALDSSNSMAGGKFEAAKQAALAYLDAAPADVRIGLVSFDGQVTVVTDPTTDHALLKEAVAGLTRSRGTLLYDGLASAADLTGDKGARSILLLSDGKDLGSTRTIDEAITAARDAEAVVDVVSLDQEPAQQALLQQIADSTGGGVVASDPASLDQTFQAQAQALASQVLVSFPRPAGAGEEADLSISLQDTVGTSYQDSALISLPPLTQPATARVSHGSWIGMPVLLIGALALSAGLAGILWIAIGGAGAGTSLAERQVEHYAQANRRPQGSLGADPASSPQNLKSTAVSAAQKLIRGDFESRLATKLSGAGLQWTSAEWLLLHAGIAIGMAFIGLVIRGPLLMVLFLLIGILAPLLYLNRKHGQRLAAFNAQLPETLQLIAGGLSAGLSMPQAIDTVVREGAEPMSGELRRALVEQRLGVDITDSLDSVATRMNSTDFGWVVMAMRIQREVGGNLAELLNTVASTMREREYLRRQVQVLSAEGRISAWVLAALPIVMAIYMSIFRPEFIAPLFTTLPGLAMLATAIVLLLSGIFVLSRMVKIEV